MLYDSKVNETSREFLMLKKKNIGPESILTCKYVESACCQPAARETFRSGDSRLAADFKVFCQPGTMFLFTSR